MFALYCKVWVERPLNQKLRLRRRVVLTRTFVGGNVQRFHFLSFFKLNYENEPVTKGALFILQKYSFPNPVAYVFFFLV